MFGDLASENVPSVLRRVHRSRMSGILHFLQDDQSIRIYFKHGDIVFAGSDNERDRLGEALVRAGRLSRPQLESALRLARDSGRSLADYLVDADILPLEIVIAEAMQRMMSIVYSIFSRDTSRSTSTDMASMSCRRTAPCGRATRGPRGDRSCIGSTGPTS